MAGNGNLLEARRIRKEFGGLIASNDIDFTIPDGSIVSLIGPNGAGKTTFFNISIIILCMVIVGGMGNIYGVMLGAMLLEYLNLKGLDKLGVRINDVLDAVGTSQTVDIPKYKFLIFGTLLVIMMLLRPEGLIPSARRKAEFHDEEGAEGPSRDIGDDLYDIRREGA